MGYFLALTERQTNIIKKIILWIWIIFIWTTLISLIYFVATLVILPALDLY